MVHTPGLETVPFARKFKDAKKVLRILHISTCAECPAPASELFTFDPDDDEFVICPICLGKTYISHAWQDRFYKAINYWNDKERVSQYINVVISELSSILSCAPIGKESLLWMDETIHRIGTEFLKTAWSKVLSREVFTDVVENGKDDALEGNSDLLALEAMRQDAFRLP